MAACEDRWANDASGLTPARDARLVRAKGAAQVLSPFTNFPGEEGLRNVDATPSPELFVAPAATFRRHSH
ncbi:hypothetical protein DB347_06875 [Opitutaceae bacterium EW11]|nr:hypothetical protein DB347_06875 [Opitutaceae bacterium EW11]